MVNYACAFSQSESGKYFEWIILILWRPYQTIIVHLFEVEKVSSHWCSIWCGFSEKTSHIQLLLYVYRLLYWNFLKFSSWNVILIWCDLWSNLQNPTITWIQELVYTVNSDTSIRRTPGVGPCHFSVIFCNYTLYKTDTFLTQTMDTFEAVNRPLRSALCSEKYFKTEL